MMMNRRQMLASSAMTLAATQLERIARAQGMAPPRFVFIFTPSGREPSWRTKTPGPDFKFGGSMTMFEPYRTKTCILDGFTLQNFGYQLNAHWGSLHSMLGGKNPLDKGGTRSAGSQRTFDHLLGDRIGKGTPVPNVVLGGLDSNNDSGSMLLSWQGPDQPQFPIHDPAKSFSTLFGGVGAPPMPAKDPSADAEARRRAQAWERDVLGLAQGQLSKWKQKLGSVEHRQLATYEAALADSVQKVMTETPDVAAEANAACGKLDYNGLAVGLSTQSFARQHDLQSRIIAAAFACGRTRVAAYHMAGLRSGMSVPGGRGGHHLHDDGALDHYRAFDLYYNQRVKFLLDELSKYPEGDGTVLDNTVILWSSDISWTPNDHDHDNIPLYMFGGLPGRKLRMGQYVAMPYDPSGGRVTALANPKNRRVHEVLLTVASAMGIPELPGFADPKYVQGPITQLLA